MSSTVDAYAWMDKAICNDMDLSEHDPFDPPTGGKYQSFVDEALAICAQCPVQAECREDALRMRDTYGVKGGTTGPEREAMLKGAAVKVPAPRSAKKSGAQRRKEQGIKTPTRTEEEKLARKARDQRLVERRAREAREDQEADKEATAREKKNERNRESRNRHRDEINARKREARLERTPQQIEADRVAARERNRKAYTNYSPSELERRRERERERIAGIRAQEKAEREAAELAEDVVVEQQAQDQAELSVA